MEKNHLVIAIYYHPEAYPPTLNAIDELSSIFNTVEIIYRPNIHGEWVYPDNVTAKASGKYISVSDQMQESFLNKVLFFGRFTLDFLKSCGRKKPSCILVYDSLALLSYYLIRPLLSFNHKIWYHNHDITEEKSIRKYSLGWYAKRAEALFVRKLDIFTLPTDERLTYFKMKGFRGKYFCIPNYPSLKFYKQFYKEKKPDGELRIIFQGRIDKDHGLEEIIPLLKDPIGANKLTLVLKGFCEESYRREIEKKAELYGVRHLIEFHPYTAYKEVPIVSSGCHIGIGIFARKDIMNQTLGTASNKVYEYAAAGLPVIYLGDSNFKRYLDGFSWAFAVELSSNCIRQKLEEIARDYGQYSKAAYTSFCESLHFEYYFNDVKNYVVSICAPL